LSKLVRKNKKDSTVVKMGTPNALVKRGTKTKIEVYDLEELVLNKYLTDGVTVKEVVKRCNEELNNRKDGLTYREINSSNVSNYLSKVKDKIAVHEGESFRETINNIGIVDKIQHLSAMVEQGWQREEIIKNDMVESYEAHDHDRFYKAIHALQNNESLMNNIVKTLATIEGKLSTCVTVEFVKSLAMKMTNEVIQSDVLNGEQKEKIIVKMSEHITFD